MSTIATFTSTPERPLFWPSTRSLEECSCPHGTWAAYSGLQNLPGPGASPSAALQNLQRLTGCDCQFAPPTHQAAVTFQAYPGVPRDTTLAVVQVAVTSCASHTPLRLAPCSQLTRLNQCVLWSGSMLHVAELMAAPPAACRRSGPG